EHPGSRLVDEILAHLSVSGRQPAGLAVDERNKARAGLFASGNWESLVLDYPHEGLRVGGQGFWGLGGHACGSPEPGAGMRGLHEGSRAVSPPCNGYARRAAPMTRV